ncbi:class I SAM-dependent methyltransferase [Isoptericola rhizosphaerae]|uniref:class I SAM-dependent methyltransferase n=1 Tax=Isoptericola rhizosphaerae TaxID=3377837 RepID=UPI00383A150D
MTRPPAPAWHCRWCGGSAGDVVLDLGDQPPAGLLPRPGDALPDPTEPLRMILCATCGLAQLEEDGRPPVEEPGVEPSAMVEQGRRVVARLASEGLLRPGSTYRQFPSPHGGDWGPMLRAAGASPWSEDDGEPADVVLDVFGLMHDADVAAAWDRRVRGLGTGSVLVVQYHSLAGDLRTGSWHTLRPGHYGYFSAPVLLAMADRSGLVPVGAWETELQGGTGVLVLARPGSDRGSRGAAGSAAQLERQERALGVLDAAALRSLGDIAGRAAAALGDYLARCDAVGLRVAGYSAASRTPVILTMSGTGTRELLAVADAAPGKQGRCLPVGRVPVVAPEALPELQPDRVVLFVPELLDEVRQTCPEVEERGGRWVVLDPYPIEKDPAARAAVERREGAR